MSGLLYREDMDEVRKRLTTWWNGGDIGRPAMQISAPRPTPIPTVPEMAQPPGWVTGYSTSSFAYRANMAARACSGTQFFAEAVPAFAPDLAPNCLALYLGCKGVETEGTVWCEPIFNKPEDARFVFDKSNRYWDFSYRLAQEALRVGKGKYLIQFEDFIEGLDTLAAMRGTEPLLTDLIERPEWVHRCLRRITDLYFHVYDVRYDMYRDEVGGSIFWAWAPGRMAKFQCDFSAMISPAMFKEFMMPVLAEMTERVSYCMYHWDGPGAIPHHDLLLSLPKLTMIQWTPGAGAEPVWHKRWWPLYHKTFDAGKRVLVWADNIESMMVLKKEFKQHFKSFLLNISVESPKQAEEALKMAMVD
ncbi:MAG TPA: hypothetical protein VM223_06780 [Planctomycetota bacterium]|nr:hypothetical protein [Planctomycetota bacterium]